ncbi:MAG: tRNA dihydrouridine synthase DusB [Phycisphaera sp.]|nr:tRNA dihydrouridine synthase DusB [Phycisphaera sp.]
MPIQRRASPCIIPAMLRIGDVQLDTNLLLAPVAGHCDLPFRLVARACGGVGIAFTDLLCPHGVLKQNEQTRWLMATNDADRPLGMQLYGQDPELMAEAAKWAVDEGATTLDINMGCPVDKVTKTYAGSMMLCTPDHTVEVAERLVKTVGDRVPVTAKTRLGFYDGELTAPTLVRRLIGVGVQCITIHGRTAAQRFKGSASYDGIRAVVDAVHDAGGGRVPCIGNGDIRTPYDAQRMLDETGCDGVMIARAALGAPWIFRDTHTLLTTGRLDEADQLTLRQRLACVRMHFRLLLECREDRYTMNRLKQKISGYGVHLGPCKPLKRAVAAMTDPRQFDEAVDRFLDESGDAANRVPVTWVTRAEQLADSDRAQQKQTQQSHATVAA